MPDNEIMPNKTYFVNRFYRFYLKKIQNAHAVRPAEKSEFYTFFRYGFRENSAIDNMRCNKQ